ncbi:MAG: hypothetical protein K8T25_20370, partial [Planctomycetia bacterium]|nr:hypothetical protein [Planctomycetia bacterium]
MQLQTFHGAFAGLVIDEPRIELESSVNYDAATSQLEVPQLTLATSAVSVRADQVVWQTAANARHAGGQIAVRADLGRLSRWLATPGSPPSLQLAGTVVGQADLAETGGMITAKMSAEAQNFVASIPAATPDRVAGPTTRPAASTQPWQPVWSEARVALAGAANYRPSNDQLDLDRCEVTSDVLRLARLQARVTELSGQRRIELTGDVDYDLARITPLLWPYVGPGVKLTGRGTRSFALSGPLAMPTNALPSSGVVSAALAGQAGVGFDRAELYGLTTSAGELRGDLKQQVVQFAPLSLSVGQGRLMLAPRIDLTSQAVLLHPAQRVAENVELTPEICQAWLKYVAPMLADATRADGKMSIDLSRCSVPLADKAKCDMAGTLLLHTAHVRPGPVAEPLVAMAQQIQMLLQKNPLGTSLGGTGGTSSDVQLNIESQNIQFEVRNGRVSHSPL